MKIIAHIHTDFTSKFGIPRQSGLVDELEATIIFEPEYRVPEALRGIEEYSHIWLLWQFSECADKEWSPTVRPPRLGGNKRMGVFATRSPFRPNPVGLSSVRLMGTEKTEKYGVVLRVAGADLLDGTPIYDIKPYLPYVDSHPKASNGFALNEKEGRLTVEIPDEILDVIPEGKQAALKAVLAQDPRPGYQNEPDRVYGIDFAGFNIRFTVDENILAVVSAEQIK
ncbi:MAG: tRNA (N6-threonylcarbamoyladenosine(37)-N6)-methyltransferase TrmO [Acutalibacteraceae bacterium]|nr:tRNA (N6-threonylcarbamoyladenosine(37)-N6)-methyltransferase TrmO [Acutalibacteraceae bacterium]